MTLPVDEIGPVARDRVIDSGENARRLMLARWARANRRSLDARDGGRDSRGRDGGDNGEGREDHDGDTPHDDSMVPAAPVVDAAPAYHPGSRTLQPVPRPTADTVPPKGETVTDGGADPRARAIRRYRILAALPGRDHHIVSVAT